MTAALTLAAFSPVLGYPFLNWDDHDVFLRNESLRAPGLVGWAFTTRYMEHYQPLSWLVWGAAERTGGLTPAMAHGLNLALHGACAAVVFLLARRMGGAWMAAAFGALFWALHPLRVEVVAWASAMPYALALLLGLLATLAWIDGRRWTAAALFAASLLARPVALGLPLVWMLIGPAAGHRRPDGKSLSVALLLAVTAALAESSARLTATLDDVGVLARLTMASAAPLRYLLQTLWPADLTPLDPIALRPAGSLPALAGYTALLAGVSVAAWRVRDRWPEAIAGWIAYLILLVPAVGLVPSGLQATADRYSYVPGVAVALAAAATVSRGLARRRTRSDVKVGPRSTQADLKVGPYALHAVALAAVIALFASATIRQTRCWRDSIALWTRAVAVDAGNDIALYNLGAALAEAGRREEALARYDQALAIAPQYEDARRNRNLLRAQALEDEGNRLASRRQIEAAIDRYADAVILDPRRAHSHAALGMALTELGRLDQARPHLQTALELGHADPTVPNALAFVLMQSGEREAALAVLREAQRRHPDDPNIARNLEMLGGRR